MPVKTATGRPHTRTGDDKCNPQQMKAIDRWFENNFRQNEALAYAGYSVSVQKCPQVVFGRTNVIMEIKRRQERLRAKTEINQEWVVRQLARIATAGEVLAKYRQIDEEGHPTWNFTGATSEDLAAIADLTVETYMDGKGEDGREVKKIRVGIADQKGAIDSIAKILGIMKDTVKHEGEVSIAERIQAGRKRLAKKS